MGRCSRTHGNPARVGFLPLLLCLAVVSAGGEDFRFLEPGKAVYRVVSSAGKQGSDGGEWLAAIRPDSPEVELWFGNRVVVRAESAARLETLVDPGRAGKARRVAADMAILQCADARSAAALADRLSRLPGVVVACPVRRQRAGFDSAYARQPDDRYFPVQTNLEYRDSAGARLGVDLNIRSAWPAATGKDVIVAVADVGVELEHPDLRATGAAGFHRNFEMDSDDGNPLLIPSATQSHGTSVAGLIAAERGNGLGIVGVAPDARYAAWVILANGGSSLINDEQMMDMFQYRADAVAVQNHSWGHVGKTQQALTALENLGVEKAWAEGRGGLGVVMVRSCGNSRGQGENVNDDAYSSDPRVIAVAATDAFGRAGATSEPGAPVLVAAPVLHESGLGVLSTDLSGVNGADQITRLPPDEGREDYRFFSGTSAAAPQISGVAALMLSVNPTLSVRDVQQLLILSSRHFDLEDPDLSANGAGFKVSHNVGFGVPDAGEAVRLARMWSNRPPAGSVTIARTQKLSIPDAGLNLKISGRDVPVELRDIRALPTIGVHPDRATAALPLENLGEALEGALPDLSGKAALIRRDAADRWGEQIERAAEAGAAFAVIHNNAEGSPGCPGGDALCIMLETDYAPIPAVFIGQTAGEALARQIATNAAVRAWLRLDSARQTFDVTEAMICEHVSLRVRSDHPVRGDLRITLTSPRGTTSVLQKLNDDLNPGPIDWTYHSVHHFFEGSQGTWTVAITDEFANNAGSVTDLELTIRGVPIVDSDADGLDDNWERARLGGLTHGPTGDPDRDGLSNAREQILGFDPLARDIELRANLSSWNQERVRLSWPGIEGRRYEILAGTAPNTAKERVAIVDGVQPETEFFTDSADLARRFFQVRELPGE